MPAPAVHPSITELDADLRLCTRTMKTAPAADRPQWKGLIDRLLDRRLELMRRHNPKPSASPLKTEH